VHDIALAEFSPISNGKFVCIKNAPRKYICWQYVPRYYWRMKMVFLRISYTKSVRQGRVVEGSEDRNIVKK
jgi:hypothetical protein